MIKIQGMKIDNVASKVVVIERTYRGEIKRTNTGVVAGYPLSFLTVGVSLMITDDKEIVRNIQQIILSANVIELQCDHSGVDFLGKFSVTSQSIEELRDKGERKATLSIELVSDGTPITKPDGSSFVVTSSDDVINHTAYYAEVISLQQLENYTLKGMSLPNNKLLVLGDVTLEPKGGA